MARRTYADFDSEVLLRLANRTDITAGQRGFFINDAYLTCAILFRHPEIEKTTVSEVIANGSDTLTPVTSDLWFPVMIRNVTNGYIIRQESRERVERAQTKPTSLPYTYYWWNKSFFFESFADTVKSLKIWYKRKPVDITTGNGSELDQMFDLPIVIEAARIALATVRDTDAAEAMEREFGEYVTKKKLPVDQAKLNDYRQGFRVRFR